MNGFDCLVYLKNQEYIPGNTHHYFHHLQKSLQDISRTRQLGASYFMTKPDDFNVLCKKLNKIILGEATDRIVCHLTLSRIKKVNSLQAIYYGHG